MRPGQEVGALSAANKQIVSMARALSHDARLIVMDEPSAVLDAGEVENLFRVVRQLTAQGVAIVYITHRLEEIRQIGDRVTVLKDGRTVATGLPVAGTETPELIRLMTGRSMTSVFPPRSGAAATAAPLLEVEGLTRTGEFSDVSFTVRPGEIVGLAGLVGSGRSEILETVYGARRPTSGSVRIGGAKVRPGSVGAAVAAGAGLAPEERKTMGLLLDQSITRNISLRTLGRFTKGGFLRRAAERDAAQANADALQMRPADIARLARTLSGGNQQKVVLARWLLRGCKVLLLDEPTRGVDVGRAARSTPSSGAWPTTAWPSS
jgi:ribose transport system ATP-binding protein